MDKQKGPPRSTRVEAGLAPILIVLLIALGIGGFLIYQKQAKPVSVSQQVPQSTPATTSNSESTNSAASPAPNGAGETANWKTYTNSNFNLLFKYPATWKINGDDQFLVRGDDPFLNNRAKLYIIDPDYNNNPKCLGDCPSFYITITVKRNNKNLDLNKVVPAGLVYTKLENISNAQGIKFAKAILEGEGVYGYFTFYQDKIYEITAVVYSDKKTNIKAQKDLKITEQILSTFKFTQ